MNICFFDLESTDLSASWGRLLCGSFADASGNVESFRGDKRRYRGKDAADCGKLAVACRDRIEAADILVSWNGIMFDIPILNAWLLRFGHREVQLTTKRKASHHLDLMYYARGAFLRMGSSKLDNVAKFFRVEHTKTPLDGMTWQLAATGDGKALDRVVEHCEADVLVLRDLFPVLSRFIKKQQISFAELNAWHEALRELPERPAPVHGLPPAGIGDNMSHASS